VASTPFTASKKYPAMLRYVVEETLAGRADHLKERNLGVVVFGRSPDYDTNQDPVVRITAAEVRKRLTVYYHTHTDQQVEIQIPAGSYFATFNARNPAGKDLPEPATALGTGIPRKIVISRKIVYACCSAIALALVAIWLYARPRPAIERFWEPLVGAQATPVICVAVFTRSPQVGQPGQGVSQPSGTASQVPGTGNVLFSQMPFSDVRALVDITSLFRDPKKRVDLRSVALTSLSDLRNRPAVVIGAFNNAWTRQLIEGLRFSFKRDNATDTQWIFDSQKPEDRRWQIVGTTAATTAPEDFGIIGRFRHPLTGEFVVVVAGLTHFGTVAAGEFVSNHDLMEQLSQLKEKDWDRKNLEIVIATKLVRSEAGPARLVATHVW
jgi:hypothetical protein